MRTLPSGNLKNFCADVYPHLCVRALKTKSYINNRKLFHAEQVLSRITFNSTLRSRLTLKSKIAFTRTWKDILTVNHESRINKSLNHVSREKNSPNHASRKKYRGPSVKWNWCAANFGKWNFLLICNHKYCNLAFFS